MSTSAPPPAPPEELATVLGAGPARFEPLGEGTPAATAGLWRVRTGGDSAVLKVVALRSHNPRWPASADPAGPWYWRREPLAYESGVPGRLAPLRSPQLRGSFERVDGSVALWLEDVPAAGPWTPERLAEVAHRLGVAQAALAADPPDEPWLARGWLRSYLSLRQLDPELAGDVEAALARLDRLPQTLVHNDLHPGNVLGRDAAVVADWAYCGLGAIGLDAGVLAVDALFDGCVEPGLADRVVEAVWQGYAAGLGRLADEAHWAYLAGTALRLSWMPAWSRRPEAPPRFAQLVPLLHRLAAAASDLRS